MHIDIDPKIEALRVSGAATLITIYGVTLSEVAAFFTIIYLAIQIIILAPKAISTIRGFKK